jgi:hypothetical protein
MYETALKERRKNEAELKKSARGGFCVLQGTGRHDLSSDLPPFLPTFFLTFSLPRLAPPSLTRSLSLSLSLTLPFDGAFFRIGAAFGTASSKKGKKAENLAATTTRKPLIPIIESDGKRGSK